MSRAFGLILCLLASTASAKDADLSPLREIYSLLKVPSETFHSRQPKDPYPVICGGMLTDPNRPQLSVPASFTGLMFVDRFMLQVDGVGQHVTFTSDLDGLVTGYGSSGVVIRLSKIDPLERGREIQKFIDEYSSEFQKTFTAVVKDILLPCIKVVLNSIPPV